MLLYVGIDEAGYGPVLGPLCVGMSAFWVQRWQPGDGVVDLWASLRSAVCRSPRDARGRLAVDDSKRLCRPLATGPGRLAHAERTVLAFCQAGLGVGVEDDLGLLEALGVQVGPLAWYGGPARPCPGHCHRSQVAPAANALGQALARAQVRCAMLRVVSLDEAAFNAVIDRGLGKAATTLSAIGRLVPAIRSLADASDAGGGDEGVHVRIVLDRQGGRVRYQRALESAFGCPVRPLSETPRASAYELADHPAVRIVVQPRAEAQHLPVALASMLAKLAREVLMERFNAYWAQRRPQVRPTAGYAQDARRWLAEMAGVLDERERRTLVRRA